MSAPFIFGDWRDWNAGIAEVLLNLGYQVQGSDLKASKITDRLAGLGATIFVAKRPKTFSMRKLWSFLRQLRPVIRNWIMREKWGFCCASGRNGRIDAKSNVAIAGTHGKTTTTTMVATLDAGALDPTVINGVSSMLWIQCAIGAGNGWLWKPTKATVVLTGCQPLLRLSPISTLNIWNIGGF